MSNTVFIVGIVTVAYTQKDLHPALVLILLLMGILADIFAYMETVQRK
jgi:hypothetical protein